jgi:hypothetical protein
MKTAFARRICYARGAWLICILICCSLFLGACFWARQQREKAQRLQCLSNLRGIAFSINLYAEAHNGNMPQNFEEMLKSQALTSRRALICPGKESVFKSETNVAAEIDYYYVPPPTGLTITNFPLVYDRSLAYHKGEGINILLSGALSQHTPSPDMLFWDPKAKWLSTFAAEHPEFRVPIPEGVK